MGNKSHEYKHWKVKMITKEQKKQYLWKSRKSWSCEHFVAKCFSAKCKLEFGEKRGSGENFLQRELSIYRDEGGSFKNLPRFDRCEVSGGRMSTPTFRGWHFLLKFKGFRGIGSSESARFPEGLVLGNSGKTCHPRNVGFDENHEISFQGGWFYEDLESWTCEALKSRTCEDLESWICEALKSRTCEDRESWTCEALKSRIREDTESWTCKALKSWTCETPKSGICEIRESIEVQIQRLRRMKISMNKRLMNQ
jgi:hypothetical protein